MFTPTPSLQNVKEALKAPEATLKMDMLQIPRSQELHQGGLLDRLQFAPPESRELTLAPVPKLPKPVGIAETQSLEGIKLYDNDGKKLTGTLKKDTEFEMTPHTAAGIINHILSTLPEGKNVLKVGKSDIPYEHRSNIYLRSDPIDLTLPAEKLAQIRDVRMIMGTLSVVTVEGDSQSAKLTFLNRSVLVARHLGKKDD